MNKQTEALKMAIEVLEHGSNLELVKVADIRKALKACKEALEQPAQEPVGYTTKFDLETACQGNTLLWFANKNGKYNVALYTHPAPQPAQEPVAWTNTDELEELKNDMTTCYMYKTPYGDEKDVALYTHPHQWQGLTDDEVNELHKQHSLYKPTIRKIEEILKEKNT